MRRRKRGRGLVLAIALAGMMLGHVQFAQAQISKGCQILLNRGLQLQGLVQWADYFHLDTYSNANYTSINWGWTSSPDSMDSTAGEPWSRWVSGTTNMPPQSGEGPYLNQLVALQLGDEWDLNTDSVRDTLVNWFNSVQTNWPNTILYHNNWAGQVLDPQLSDFIARAQPDMLFFDGYPWQSDYTTGTPLGGPPTSWYSELRRYRAWAMTYNIPFGVYRQTFHAVQDYNSTIYRNPSPSELRLLTSAALAFNAKFFTDFVYNSGATSLFDILPNGYSGDLYTNALYVEQADANRRAFNLGKALMCLKPIYELHNPTDATPPPGPASAYNTFVDGTVTGIMIEARQADQRRCHQCDALAEFLCRFARLGDKSGKSDCADLQLVGIRQERPLFQRLGRHQQGGGEEQRPAGRCLHRLVQAAGRELRRAELHQRSLFPGRQWADRHERNGGRLPAGDSYGFLVRQPRELPQSSCSTRKPDCCKRTRLRS